MHFGLSDGRIYRWWAINIPLNLLPDSGFAGDIDLMACTRGTPFERRGAYFTNADETLAGFGYHTLCFGYQLLPFGGFGRGLRVLADRITGFITGETPLIQKARPLTSCVDAELE